MTYDSLHMTDIWLQYPALWDTWIRWFGFSVNVISSLASFTAWVFLILLILWVLSTNETHLSTLEWERPFLHGPMLDTLHFPPCVVFLYTPYPAITCQLPVPRLPSGLWTLRVYMGGRTAPESQQLTPSRTEAISTFFRTHGAQMQQHLELPVLNLASMAERNTQRVATEGECCLSVASNVGSAT